MFRFDVNQDIRGVEKVYGFYQVVEAGKDAKEGKEGKEAKEGEGNARVIGWKISGEDLVKTW